MTRMAYYPGCSLHKNARNYDESIRKLFSLLGIDLAEIPDWNCCGATSAHFTDEALSLALPARNLALAEQQGHHTVFAPCAACYNRLLLANRIMADRLHGSEETRADLEPLTYQGSLTVRNLLDVLFNEVGTARLAALVQTRLSGLKVAPYYGCLLVRSPGVDYFEDRENPTSMDRLLEATGAEVVEWSAKTDCCGASLAVTEEDITTAWIGKILEAAHRAGANCIATACPLCQNNLDMVQFKKAGRQGVPQMPVFFLSELLGLSVGARIGRREWRKHFIRPDKLLKSLSIPPVAEPQTAALAR